MSNNPRENAAMPTTFCRKDRVPARRQDARTVFRADRYPDPRPTRTSLKEVRHRAKVGISRRRAALQTVLMVAALALAVIVIAAVLEAAGALDEQPASANGPASTPVAQWEKGSVPFLYQTDPAWADEPYAGGTIAKNGCGPTCLSMVYVCLTGKHDRGPAEMCAFSEKAGYVSGDETAWALMTDGAGEIGLESHEVPADARQLVAELQAGHPVIASMRPGDFTTTGHFIVIAGVDDAGNLVVHDPNSAERSQKTWDPERVLGQCANLWAFSA